MGPQKFTIILRHITTYYDALMIASSVMYENSLCLAKNNLAQTVYSNSPPSLSLSFQAPTGFNPSMHYIQEVLPSLGQKHLSKCKSVQKKSLHKAPWEPLFANSPLKLTLPSV